MLVWSMETWQVAEFLLSKMLQTGPLHGSGPMDGVYWLMMSVTSMLLRVALEYGQTMWA